MSKTETATSLPREGEPAGTSEEATRVLSVEGEYKQNPLTAVSSPFMAQFV